MKSFRAEKQKKNATTQVIVTLMVLLTSIILVRYFPADVKNSRGEVPKTTWESSVIKLP